MSPGVPVVRTTAERSGRRVVVRVTGELDLATAPELRRSLSDAAARPPVSLVVDLSGVAFIDATGLAALLEAAQAVRAEGGDLRLASPSRMLRRMLQLLELQDRLPVEPG